MSSLAWGNPIFPIFSKEKLSITVSASVSVKVVGAEARFEWGFFVVVFSLNHSSNAPLPFGERGSFNIRSNELTKGVFPKRGMSINLKQL